MDEPSSIHMNQGAKASTLLGGRYELTEPLGFGGMAEVWKARDKQLNRDVAVKLLSVPAGLDPGRRRRIEREARALASLSHPNVVAVFDYGEEIDGSAIRPYIVIELVEGSDLHRRLEESGGMQIDEVRELLSGILAGVGAAHAAGVVHGDLKPANVLLGPHGPKVSDFGVARVAGEETGLTTAAATPTYASPEVLRGSKPTAASDVYSVACIAFTVLTGRPPYEGANAWEVASKHLESPLPSVRLSRADVPVGLDEAIRKAMNRDPLQRPTVDELREAIDIPTIPLPISTPDQSPETVPVTSAPVNAPEPTEALGRPTDLRAVAFFGPLAAWATGIGNWVSRRRRLLIAVGLIALLGGLAYAAAPDLGLRSSGVEVPDLKGQNFAAAVRVLEEAGLDVSGPSYAPIDSGPGGLVIRTIPAAGKVVEEGTDVHIVVGAVRQTPPPAPSARPDDDDDGRGNKKGRNGG